MKKAITVFIVSLILSATSVAPVQAGAGALDLIPESIETPGRINGSGTYFEVTNSGYLDISLESTDEIKLTLESVPQVVTMVIESATGAVSTQITLGGLLPVTTYYKYEDDFHNLEIFTTDAAGTHVYVQDLANSHIIFIQPTHSTYFIRDDVEGGDCLKQSIGTWDAETKTCTLIKDVDQTIEIDSDGITLDGAGYRLTRGQGSNGIFLSKRENVTVKNVTIEQFSYGIYLFQSKNNQLTGNTLSGNYRGIYLAGKSDDNLLVDNYVLNHDDGICLSDSKNNKLTENSLSDNYRGIYLDVDSDDNVIAENFATQNTYGIYLNKVKNNVIADNSVGSNKTAGIRLTGSTDNSLTNNTVDANTSYGIYFVSSSDKNTLTGNTISNNGYYGLTLILCSKNIIYNNNFIDNTTQAWVVGGADNLFNMDTPTGGNYWNNYDKPEEGCNDEDDDGFCDAAYNINSILDEFAWTIANGWLDSDGDGIPDDEDECPNTPGPADQNGCPFADETHVSMRIVDFQRSGVCGYNNRGWAKRSCTVDLEAVMVRIYDREDGQFLEAYGRWPSRRRLDDIYQADIGLTGLCTTDENGKCLVGEDKQGKFLVVAKYVDLDGRQTVYIGKFKDFRHHGYAWGWNWCPKDTDADSSTPPTTITKNLSITKLIPKYGPIKFLGTYITVADGP